MRVARGDLGRQGEAGGRGGGWDRRAGSFSQVTGAFLNVNGLQSKTQALQAWLEGAQHPPDPLGLVEMNKEEGEAPTPMADYTRVAVSGSGGRRNRGVELYIHKETSPGKGQIRGAPRKHTIGGDTGDQNELLGPAGACPPRDGGVRFCLPGMVGPDPPGGVFVSGPQVRTSARRRQFSNQG